MFKKLLILFFCIAGIYLTPAKAQTNMVAMKTDLGTFVIELYPAAAPETVKNFLAYVDHQFYDGTIFHRIVPGFVVQGGGMTFDFTEKPTADPVINESVNGLKNDYQSVAMARKTDPNSATAQFFINLNNNTGLNANGSKPGYTVFGKVIVGMDVVEKMAREPLGMFKAFPEAPNYAIRILKATRIDSAALKEIVQTQNATKPSSIKDALVPIDANQE